jgi:hypothetical protein
MIIDSGIVTGSLTSAGPLAVTGSVTSTVGFTGSLSGSATSAVSASYVLTSSYTTNALTSSFATSALTASYVANASSFPFTGSAVITGSAIVTGSLTVTGNIVAQTLVVQTITSSTNFVTGSSRFGTLVGVGGNTHQFTGSLLVTRSLIINGGLTDFGYELDVNGTARVTGVATFNSAVSASSLHLATSSTDGNAAVTYRALGRTFIAGVGGPLSGYVEARNNFYIFDNNASSVRFYINNSGSAIFSNNVIATSFSGSLSGSATNAVSASYALTASHALNSGGAAINTSSFATTGSNIFNGNQTITGSLVVSASITGSNIRATGNVFGSTIGWSSDQTSNGGEIRIGQTAIRFRSSIPIQWSQTTDSNGTKDLGIRRNNTGSLEIYDGVTDNGAIANRRDLLARNITGSNALISGSLTVSGSANISGSLSLNGSVLSATSGYQQTFTAATTWTATHNLNTLFPVVTVYNASSQVIIPTSITSTSANVTTITFNVPVAGTVNIISGQLQQNIAVSNPSAIAIATVLGG